MYSKDKLRILGNVKKNISILYLLLHRLLYKFWFLSKKYCGIILLIVLLMLFNYLCHTIERDFSLLVFLNILFLGTGSITWIIWDLFTVKILSVIRLRNKSDLSLGKFSNSIFSDRTFFKKTVYPIGFVFSMCVLKWEFTEIPSLTNIFLDFFLFTLLLPLSVFIVPTKWVLDEANIMRFDNNTKRKERLIISPRLEHFIDVGAVLAFFIAVIHLWKNEGWLGMIGMMIIILLFLSISSLMATILYARFSYRKHLENVRMLIKGEKYKFQKKNFHRSGTFWKVVIFLGYVVIIGLILSNAPFSASNQTGTKHYSNTQYGFSFEYPNTWRRMTPEEADKTVMSANSTISKKGKVVEFVEQERKIGVYISVLEGDNVTDKDLQQIINDQDEVYNRSFCSFQKVSDKLITVKGVKGYEYIFTFRLPPKYFPSNFWTYECKKTYLYKNEMEYIISCSTLSSDFDKYNNKYFIPLINSFKIEDFQPNKTSSLQ